MPNWCDNRVEIYGDNPDQIKEVKKTLASKETCFDFNNIVPMPKELEGTTSPNPEPDSFEAKRLRKQHGHDNWYDWCCDNWDTKWNSAGADLTSDSNNSIIEYEFQTAWGPPIKVIEALREQYPDLNITAFYDEPGMEMAGYY